jgi:hypothetical protein
VQYLALLMPLLGIIGFAAWIWLVVVAFKRSPLWGVLVLLLSPVSAIVYAVKFWGEAKRPFLAYAGSATGFCLVLGLLAAFAAGAVMDAAAEAVEEGMEPIRLGTTAGGTADGDAADATAEGGEALAASQERNEDPLDRPASRAVDERAPATPAGDAAPPRGTAPTPASTPAPIPDPNASDGAAARYAARDLVALRDLDGHVGQTLRVVTSDGMDFEGVYMGRDGQRFEFGKKLAAGTLAVYVTGADVRSLHRIKNP